MHELTYYVDTGKDAISYDYYEIVHAISNGTVGKETTVLVYDNYTREKREIKARELIE